MKTELLIAGVVIVGFYLWSKNQSGGNTQRLQYVRVYQNDGVTPQDVGSLGSQINQAGISVASNVANAGLGALQNWALDGIDSLNRNSSGVHGPTDTNVTNPDNSDYTTSS